MNLLAILPKLDENKKTKLEYHLPMLFLTKPPMAYSYELQLHHIHIGERILLRD